MSLPDRYLVSFIPLPPYAETTRGLARAVENIDLFKQVLRRYK